MPMLLPERRVPDTEEQRYDVSPLLSIVAALLAVLLVLAEARAMGTIEWPAQLPDPSFAARH
jgi:hypothetical protein